jgi:DNA primase
MLPPGSDPASLLYRDGADAVQERIADACGFARFQVEQQITLADIKTAEGKDRLIGELHGVFANIPPSAVREDLIARVAKHLALAPQLVSSWMPTPATPTAQEGPITNGPARPLMVDDGSVQRDLLARCLRDSRVAAALPSGSELEKLFPDDLARRAAEHIRSHASEPTAHLPAEEHELIAFITGLLTASV